MRSRFRWSAVLCTFALVGIASVGVAHAKPTADEASSAREHYKRGTTLYDLGKYDEAIIEFQQAYEIKDDPVLLYNIAQSYRLANRYPDALRFYRTYLRKSPKAPNRDEVETKIADMENLIAQQQKVATSPSVDVVPPRGDRPSSIGATPQTVATRSEPATTSQPARTEPTSETPRGEARAETPPPPGETHPSDARAEAAPAPGGDSQPKPGRGLLIGGIVLAVVGVAALAAGIGLGAVASSDSSTQSSNKVFDPSLDSQGKSFQTVGLVLDIAGGALLAVGVIVAVVGATKKPVEQPKVTLLPTLGRDSAGAALGFRF